MISGRIHPKSGTITKIHAMSTAGRDWYWVALGIAVGWALGQTGLRIQGGAVAVLGFAPLYLKLERQLFPGLLFGPLSLAFLMHIMGYAIGPLGQMYIVGRMTAIEDGFVPAQWGAVLGLAAFALVFPPVFRSVQHWLEARSKPSISAASDADWSGYAVVMLLAGIAVLGYGLLTGAANRLGGGQGSVDLGASSLASILTGVHQTMFFALAYVAARRGRRWWALWGVVLVGYSAFFILDGSRAPTLLAVIFSAMGFAWAGIAWRKLVIVGALFAVFFVPVFEVVLAYRDSVQLSSRVSFNQRVDGFMAAVTEFGSENRGSLAGSTQAFFAATSAQFVDGVFLLTPAVVPFAGFKDIEQIAWAPVPLFLYPGRPSFLDGNQLAILYNPSRRPNSVGLYMPSVGEGYRRWGWPGIPIYYAFLAVVYGCILAICWVRRSQRNWMIMLVWFSYQATGVWSATLVPTFWLALGAVPRQWVVFWGLCWAADRLSEVFGPRMYDRMQRKQEISR